MNSCPVAAGFVSGSITRMPNANVIYFTSPSFPSFALQESARGRRLNETANLIDSSQCLSGPSMVSTHSSPPCTAVVGLAVCRASVGPSTATADLT